MIAVLGYKGFIGSYVYEQLVSIGCQVTGYGRGDSWGYIKYDTVFDCRAFFSKRSCHGVSEIDDGTVCVTKRYVLVSSIDAESIKSQYGALKHKQECIALEKYKERLVVVRCASVYGKGLRRGPVFDAMRGETWLSDDSKIRLTPIHSIILAGLIGRSCNNWSKDYITPMQLRNHFKVSGVKRLGDAHEDYSGYESTTNYTIMDVLNV